MSVEIPRVPRSTSRVSPPVCRARWKRSDSACRWRKTSSAIVRTARCVAFANRNSRSSVNAVVDRRNRPYAAISASGTDSTAVVVSNESTIAFSSTGTPTFASLAATSAMSAAITRPLYANR
jgi:hypothetical protein